MEQYEIDALDDLFLNPLSVSSEVWDTVNQLARIVMRREKCDYHRAIVVAYFEVFNMAKSGHLVH